MHPKEIAHNFLHQMQFSLQHEFPITRNMKNWSRFRTIAAVAAEYCEKDNSYSKRLSGEDVKRVRARFD